MGGRWLTVRVPGFATDATADGPLARAREQAMRRQERAGQAGDGLVAAPMQGTVALIAVTEGEEVAEGQMLAVVEAMKMAQGAALCRIVPDVSHPEPSEN